LAANDAGEISETVDAEDKGTFAGFWMEFVSAYLFAAVQQKIVRTWGVATEPCDCKWCGDVAAEEKDAETYVFHTACLRGYCYDEAD
jgi:hypothetical protein